jgi:MFS family permease
LDTRRDLRYNLIVNLTDGSFFGLGMGFASFVTILPLFVSSMTSSALLIGLIPAIHNIGWQLPQLLTAQSIARQKRIKPLVLWMTLHERLPFLFLAGLAWLSAALPVAVTLTLAFIILIWQGLGAGATANPWQSMIGKIIPSNRRGAFYGVQSAGANMLAALGAIGAGVILEWLPSPQDFVLCFLIASAALAISYGFLSLTREKERPAPPPVVPGIPAPNFWTGVRDILRRDINFRWFMVSRGLNQLAVMASAFFTVYAVGEFGVSESLIGVMTAVYLGTQIIAGPLMGTLGDRIGHRLMMELGAASTIASGLLAWLAPGPGWFFLVFILAGLGNVAMWTIGMAMILEFGEGGALTFLALRLKVQNPARAAALPLTVSDP